MPDTGWLNLSTFSDDASVGTASWSNTGNAVSSNDSYAEASGENVDTHYLKALDLSAIPPNINIIGIEVRIERFTDYIVEDRVIRLVIDGTVSGDNKSTSADWQTSDDNTYVSFGGATDLWGLSITEAQVKASNFGFVLQARCFRFTILNGNFPSTAKVDHMQMKIYYEYNGDFFMTL